jgi:hypothetical protein
VEVQSLLNTLDLIGKNTAVPNAISFWKGLWEQASKELNFHFSNILFIQFHSSKLLDTVYFPGALYHSLQYLLHLPMCTVRIIMKEVCTAFWVVPKVIEE